MQVSNFARLVTVQPGDNLFRIAAIFLGDASQWTRIAQLNLAALGGVADPFIPAGMPVTLQLPPKRKNAGSGGIFGQ